ncbi:MAG: amidohydrolase, partial [Sphingopyxis sp.]|nr:amidohydrolase [Sphingopyxis sp.]
MRAITTTIASVIALSLGAPAAAQSLNEQIRGQMPALMDLYREMHANPELSGMEVQSAARMA